MKKETVKWASDQEDYKCKKCGRYTAPVFGWDDKGNIFLHPECPGCFETGTYQK